MTHVGQGRSSKRVSAYNDLVTGRAFLLHVSLGAGVALLTAGPAHAESKAEAARSHFEKGTVFYNLNRFPDALVEFEAGYLAKSDPVFLFNIAQCHRQAGNHAQALSFYKNYLRAAKGASNRPEVE